MSKYTIPEMTLSKSQFKRLISELDQNQFSIVSQTIIDTTSGNISNFSEANDVFKKLEDTPHSQIEVEIVLQYKKSNKSTKLTKLNLILSALSTDTYLAISGGTTEIKNNIYRSIRNIFNNYRRYISNDLGKWLFPAIGSFLFGIISFLFPSTIFPTVYVLVLIGIFTLVSGLCTITLGHI